MSPRPRRPAQGDYDRALGLYRANCSPEQIAERVGLELAQVERAINEGWPPVRGKLPKPPLRAFEHVIEDRLHRLELARLDWAQKAIEGAAAHTGDWTQAIKKASAIKQAILSAWGAIVADKMKAASVGRMLDPSKIKISDLAIPIDLVRSLRTLDALMNAGSQKQIVDVFRFLSGVDDEDDAVGEVERIQARLAGLTEDQIAAWEDAGGDLPEPEQGVIQFPTGTED